MSAYCVGFEHDGSSTPACLVSGADEIAAICNAGGPTLEGTVAVVLTIPVDPQKPAAARYRCKKGQWVLESRSP
jgi:hypothetical protein